MNKKIIVSGIVLVVIALGAGSYFLLGPKQSGDSVTIGALVPLTGQLTVLGENMRNGMEIAKQDLVSEGVVTKLNIIYEDACDDKSSLVAAKKLIEVDKVKVIGSSFCLLGIDAISPMTESNKVILFNTAANPESSFNKKYLFSTNIAIRNDSEKMAKYAFQVLGAKTVAMIQLETSFGKSYLVNFTKSFEALGGKVLSSSAWPYVVSDFKPELTKIKAENPDLLLIIHFGNSLGNAIKQARDLGIKSTIMGDYESEDTTVVRLAREATEGIIISSSEPEVKTKNVSDFEKKYLAQFGELPDVLASNAYDAIKLQVTTFVACNGDTDCMARELEKIKDYDGVSGNITITKDHSVEKSTIFKVVKDGKFVEIK